MGVNTLETYKLTFNMPFSLQNRQAETLCRELAKIESSILVSKDGCSRICNAKSPAGIMSLNISEADNVLLRIDGSDSDVAAVKQVLKQVFN